MLEIQLSAREAKDIDDLVANLFTRYPSATDQDFLRTSGVWARDMPHRLSEEVEAWRLAERDAGCLIQGLSIPGDLVRTPAHWREAAQDGLGAREEMLLVLLANLVGDVFGWATQQDGRLVHDVLPIREHENEQLGSGSKETLWWHTEDAFHPLRGDYLALLCLRNPYDAVTTVATSEDLDLTRLDLDTLCAANYTIRPDKSHLPHHNRPTGEDPFVASAAAAIAAMVTQPDQVPVLFGARTAPYLRLDPYFVAPPEDARVATALAGLVEALEDGLRDVVLRPGDCLILDNYRAVHGRRAFTARFDGTDRWLKRANITRDLRKSRAVRRSAEDRIVH